MCLLCIHIALLLSRIMHVNGLSHLTCCRPHRPCVDSLYGYVSRLQHSILFCTVALLIVPLVSEASSRSLLLVRISCSRPHPSFSASFSVPSKMPMVHMDIDGARRVKKLSPNLAGAGGSCYTYSDNEKNIQENGTSESGRNAGLAITQGQVYPALSQSH